MSAVAVERGLFAAKGGARPVGADPSIAADSSLEAASASAPGKAQQTGDRSTTTPDTAAGSLLTFRLRPAPGKTALSDEIKSALARPMTVTQPEEPPSSIEARGEAMGEPTITTTPGAARLDRPLFPRERRGRDTVAALRPTPAAPRPSAWRTVLPLGCAVLAIAGVGWLVAQGDRSAPDPVPVPMIVTDASSESGFIAADAPAAASPATVAGAPETTLPPTKIVAGAASLPPDAPSFEVVQVTPDAPPVLGGRAAPGAELIVLDNGDVIGKATADANGDWTLVTEAVLPAGRHELTLALATPEGAVVVEQADARAALRMSNGGELPLPGSKPASDAAPQRLYMVQLASVPSARDAEREWARLQQAFPARLGMATAEIAGVEIDQRGTFYRVRTGPFADRDAARGFCRELTAAGQDCLVVRTEPGE